MGDHTATQGRQIVAPLEKADYPAAGAKPGKLDQAIGDPGVIVLDQIDVSHFILTVRIKTSRYQYQLGLKALQGRQPLLSHQLAYCSAARIGFDGDIDHVGTRIVDTHTRKQWILIKAAHHHAPVMCKSLFGTIAVMDIEIDNGNTRQAMMLKRIVRGNRDIVEETKPHGLPWTGMMPWRPHRTKGSAGPAGHDLIDGRQAGTGRHPGRLHGVRVHPGVGIYGKIPLGRGVFLQELQIFGCMDAKYVFSRGGPCLYGIEKTQQTAGHKLVRHGTKPLRTLWMPATHFVQMAGWMSNI